MVVFCVCLRKALYLSYTNSFPPLCSDWLVNRLEMSRPLAYHVQCVGALANRSATLLTVWDVNKGVQWRRFRRRGGVICNVNCHVSLITDEGFYIWYCIA